MDNQTPVPVKEILVLPASILKRLSNHILDSIFISVLPFILSFVGFFFDPNTTVILNVIGTILYIIYFPLFESIWQKTPGKWITKTKVVDREGNKPTFLRVLGRSFARIIPFEPLSFLFNKYPMGWHDLLSKTYVVDDALAQEEVKKIDKEKIKKEHSVGTLGVVVIIIVFVLLMISIIGILASVVLASLNVARNKSNDAAIRSVMSNLRFQSEVYKDTNNSYLGFCSDQNTITLLKGAAKYSTQFGNENELDYTCNDSEEAWIASIPLKTEGYWCVDSAGKELMSNDVDQAKLSCSY